MATDPTTKNQNILRRRMHILERAQNTFSSKSDDPLASNHHQANEEEEEEEEDEKEHSPSDYESDSESSEDVKPTSTSPQRSPGHSTPLGLDTSGTYEKDQSASPTSPSTRAWYEFDLAVVVALVSPIGNWLTGGDHVKNLLLIILLIFYLHQIIEIPWALYNRARPRRRPRYLPQLPLEDHYRELAASELHLLELFFLALTVLSPFIGAVILRAVTHAVSGEDIVSWFSTSLFILSTGIRPWRHVIDRVTQRTNDLHNVIHYPSTSDDPAAAAAEDTQKQLQEVLSRVTDLERSMEKMRERLAQNKEDIYDYVDESIDVVEKSVKRYERKCEKQDVRVKVVEESVESLKTKGRRMVSFDSPSILAQLLPSWLIPPPRYESSPINFESSPTSSTSKLSLRSFPSSTIRLETIPEETITTTIKAAPPPPPLYRQLPGMNLAARAGYTVTLPLRALISLFISAY